MHFFIGLTISTILTVIGLCKIAWPGILIDRQGNNSGPPAPEEVWQSRWQGFAMLTFGVIGLYAVLTWDGTPAEFIGV